MAGERVRWLDEAEQQVWRSLLRVHARFSERLESELVSRHGVSLADYDVLVALSEAPGEQLRMSTLASKLLVSRSGVTRRVDSLVRRGLVERRPCPGDRRGSLAALSLAGAAILAEAAPTHVAGVRRYLIDPLAARASEDRGAPGLLAGPGAPAGLEGLATGLALVEDALAGTEVARGCEREALQADEVQPAGVQPAGVQRGEGPATTCPPRSTHPMVPPATDTAL